jgi:hypothetical protein
MIVVEGSTDVETYRNLLTRYGVPEEEYAIFAAHGKGYVCNTNTWKNIKFKGMDLLSTLINDTGREDFLGILLLVDSDAINETAFDNYERNADPGLNYVKPNKPTKEHKGTYWYLDTINGAKEIPIYGIAVPLSQSGCLETDLLASYGFPIEGQDEYSNFVDIIQKSSNVWQIPKHKNGKDWWMENQKAKLDKFIYSALSHGFDVSREVPALPQEPSVISNIKSVISG